MEVITTYKAFDGTTFEDEDECYRYEACYKINAMYAKGIKVCDDDGEPIKAENLVDKLNTAGYVYISTLATGKEYNDLLDYEGYEQLPLDENEANYPMYFYYDYDRDAWKDAKKTYEEASERMQILTKD